MAEAASIMIVDDTPANLRLLQEILQEKGHRVVVFPRGALALKAAARKPPDLILLDIQMPDMDGYEVCRRFKADPGLRDVPVLFLSALSETMDKVRAFELGGVDYVTKPFQPEEIQARVNTHLRLRAKTPGEFQEAARALTRAAEAERLGRLFRIAEDD